MTEEQLIKQITVHELLDHVRARRVRGARLVQISATILAEQVELTYSFDRDGSLSSLRFLLPTAAAHVPSIGGIYPGAFLYENELHDLFNVQVEGLTVDFHGHLYNTTVKYPFTRIQTPAPKKAPVAPSAQE